jgi:hypothetical protein
MPEAFPGHAQLAHPGDQVVPGNPGDFLPGHPGIGEQFRYCAGAGGGIQSAGVGDDAKPGLGLENGYHARYCGGEIPDESGFGIEAALVGQDGKGELGEIFQGEEIQRALFRQADGRVQIVSPETRAVSDADAHGLVVGFRRPGHGGVPIS